MKIKVPSLKLNKRELIQWLSILGMYMPILIFGISIKLILEIICISIAGILIYQQMNHLKVSINLICVFFSIVVVDMIIITINNYPYGRFIEQIVMLLFYFILYYIIFGYIKNSLNEVFNKYLTISFYIAVLGILQEVIFLCTGISIFRIFTYDRDILAGPFVRINVFAGEPSNLATLLTPAFVYYLLNLKKNTKRFFIIFIALIFTFSTVSLLIATLAFMYKFIVQSKVFVRLFFLVCFLLLFLIGFSSDLFSRSENETTKDISMKIEDTVNGLSGITPEAIELLNLSSYASIMNLYISLNAPTRLIGTGLGTHPCSYERLYHSEVEFYGLNKNDAYSMFIRIYSEMGLLGLIILFVFIIKNFNNDNYVNISVLFILASFMIRGGHYTLSGTVFFFFLYYYTGNKFSNR